MKAGLEHLASSTIYEQIENDPTKPLSVAINTLIQQAHRKGWLSDYMRNYLRLDVSHVIVQQAYFLKKLHKDLIAMRPIVSGVGGPTEAISSFLDYYMQPHVLQIKSYVGDSASLIRLLEETQFPPEISLVTIDVKALYLNIPHHEGVQACLDRLYGDNPDLDPPPFLLRNSWKLYSSTTILSSTAPCTARFKGLPWAPRWPPLSLACSWRT